MEGCLLQLQDVKSRARSATEAFLYRRLETLPETSGRFRLNVELPIPLDGWGRMEVDLLCAEARVLPGICWSGHFSSGLPRLNGGESSRTRLPSASAMSSC
jgi:hypothetical protein